MNGGSVYDAPPQPPAGNRAQKAMLKSLVAPKDKSEGVPKVAELFVPCWVKGLKPPAPMNPGTRFGAPTAAAWLPRPLLSVKSASKVRWATRPCIVGRSLPGGTATVSSADALTAVPHGLVTVTP